MASLISSSSSCYTATLLLLLLFLAVPTSINASFMGTMRSFFRDTEACPDLACCQERWLNVSRTKGLQFSPGNVCHGRIEYSPEFGRVLDKACHCYNQYGDELLPAYGLLKLLMRTQCNRSPFNTRERARMIQEFCVTYNLQPPPFLSPEEMERDRLTPSNSRIICALLCFLCIAMWCIRIFQMLVELRIAKNEKDHKY